MEQEVNRREKNTLPPKLVFYNCNTYSVRNNESLYKRVTLASLLIQLNPGNAPQK